MHHMKAISRPPSKATDIPISNLLTFITAMLNAVIALLTAKEAAPTA